MERSKINTEEKGRITVDKGKEVSIVMLVDVRECRARIVFMIESLVIPRKHL